MAKSTSSSTGKSYQTNHTYFFVPAALGNRNRKTGDDTNEPGAFLRLGGYSDLESKAAGIPATKDKPAIPSRLDKFYPREYGDDLVDDDTGQILLSGSGQMLVHAGGKIFINSHEEMDIDSVKKLSIHSDDEITVNSGKKKNITIMAGPDSENLGDISLEAHHDTTTIYGKKTTKVTEDTYSYFEADSYSIKMGRDTATTLGGRFWFFLGGSMSVNAAATTTINIALNTTLGCSATFSIDIYSMSLTLFKAEIKRSSFKFGVFAFRKEEISAEQKQIDVQKVQIAAMQRDISASQMMINSNQINMNSEIASLKNTIATLNNNG